MGMLISLDDQTVMGDRRPHMDPHLACSNFVRPLEWGAEAYFYTRVIDLLQ